jgi:hypothetical protein
MISAMLALHYMVLKRRFSMNKYWIILPILSLTVAACGMIEVEGQILDPTENAATQITTMQVPTDAPTIAPTNTPVTPQLSFEAVTYQDKDAGFAFEYPADWGVGFQETQSRGYVVQLQDIDGPRLDVVVLLWDPKGDLPAFLEVRKTAWESSDIAILEEESITLANGQEGVTYVVEGRDGNQGFFFFTTLTDRYLQLSGNGDVAILEEIAGTVRVFEPVKKTVEGEPIECFTVTDQSELWVPCNVIDSIRSRNLAAAPSWMADPFIIGYWGSEGREDTPFGIIEELRTSRLPQDPSLPMSFTTDRDAFPPLAGTPVEVLFGPDVDVALVIYSEGWGLNGEGAALLYFAEDAEGELYWYALAYSETHFDK